MALKYNEIPIPIADASKQYRLYYSKQYYCIPCPECLGLLVQKFSVGVITSKFSNHFVDNVLILDRFGYFCNKCPVMVVDVRLLDAMNKEILKNPETDITFAGLVNLTLVPDISNVDIENLFEKEKYDPKYLTTFLLPKDNKNVPHIMEFNINKAFPFDLNLSIPIQNEYDKHIQHPSKQNLTKEQENTIPKTLPGRNDPCYCGSGKKFKSCCAKLFT